MDPVGPYMGPSEPYITIWARGPRKGTKDPFYGPLVTHIVGTQICRQQSALRRFALGAAFGVVISKGLLRAALDAGLKGICTVFAANMASRTCTWPQRKCVKSARARDAGGGGQLCKRGAAARKGAKHARRKATASVDRCARTVRPIHKPMQNTDHPSDRPHTATKRKIRTLYVFWVHT